MEFNVMHRSNSKLAMLSLLPLMLLVSACASTPAYTPVKPPARPLLPTQLMAPTVPLWCYPTCLAALTKEREIWQTMLTGSE